MVVINDTQWQSIGTVSHSGTVSNDVVVINDTQWQSIGTVGGAVSSDVVVINGNQWQLVAINRYRRLRRRGE